MGGRLPLDVPAQRIEPRVPLGADVDEDRTHEGARCASASVIDPTRLSYQIVDEPLLGEG